MIVLRPRKPRPTELLFVPYIIHLTKKILLVTSIALSVLQQHSYRWCDRLVACVVGMFTRGSENENSE